MPKNCSNAAEGYWRALDTALTEYGSNTTSVGHDTPQSTVAANAEALNTVY
jgi:hypothetical protein